MHKIGPYECPIDIAYNKDLQQGNAVATWRYYQYLQETPSALAIFNNANYCFVILHADCVTFEPFISGDTKLKRKLPSFYRTPAISSKQYECIGYWRTNQPCKAVYQYPWYLIRERNTGEVVDVSVPLQGDPVVDPPLSIYKELIATNYSAVYLDKRTNKTMFI